MKFWLLDKQAKEKVHEGVMMRVRAPQVVAWGSRAFALKEVDEGEAVFVEVDCFRIGS